MLQQTDDAAPNLSVRSSKVSSFVVMKVMCEAEEKQAQLDVEQSNERVLHLEVGQPSSGAPKGAIKAAVDALQSGNPLGYTSALGYMPLRERLAHYYKATYDVALKPRQFVVTTGSSAAFTAVFTACFDVGDRVALAVPGYPCYRHILTALGVQVVTVRVYAKDNYQLMPENVAAAADRVGGVQGVIVASPSNPTGTVVSHDILRQLVSYCDERRAWLISDEIYHGITHERVCVTSAAQLSKRAVVINSFSKYFSMTGFRVGWLACRDERLIEAIDRLLQNMNICAPAISQRAALGAFDCREELDEHVRRYSTNLALLLRTLPSVGFEELYRPQGAFYMFVGCRRLLEQLGLRTSVQLCSLILEQANVALTPGVDFDPEQGIYYVRFSCAGSTKDIMLACERLMLWAR